MEKQYCRAKYLSQKLGVPHQTLYSWVKNGLIPFIRVGNVLLFDEQEIDNWLSERKFKPTGKVN